MLWPPLFSSYSGAFWLVDPEEVARRYYSDVQRGQGRRNQPSQVQPPLAADPELYPFPWHRFAPPYGSYRAAAPQFCSQRCLTPMRGERQGDGNLQRNLGEGTAAIGMREAREAMRQAPNFWIVLCGLHVYATSRSRHYHRGGFSFFLPPQYESPGNETGAWNCTGRRLRSKLRITLPAAMSSSLAFVE